MASIDSIDWLKWLRVNALDQPDLLLDRFPNAWLLNECGVAADMVQAECQNVAPRYQNGLLKERTLGYVVSQMVLRVVRYRQFKTESNGSYSYTNFDAQNNPPGKDGSMNLYVSKREKALLEGHSDSMGPMGTVHMGLDRAYGM